MSTKQRVGKGFSAFMKNDGKTKLTRREILKASLTAGGVALVGFHEMQLPAFGGDVKKDGFQGGKYLGRIQFLGEGRIPMDTPMGDGLDGRLYTDLSAITPESLITPTGKFYVRTGASDLLDDRKLWVIKVGGLVSQSAEVSMTDLRKISRPAGLHLMECSGNVRLAHFGMLSVADWTGARVSELLDSVKIDRAASHILISGFDRYPDDSPTSTPGKSWIFTLGELSSSKAFFATEMNGASLTRDHGAPVRLVVPGWYGCACIKWVDEITLLGENAETTSQMREYAGRTMQHGVPELVKDYRPAIIEQAAMPIRTERWLVERKIKYRVTGIAWGGSRPISTLEIRFSSEPNSSEDFIQVDDFAQPANDPWSFWTHAWTPTKPGTYFIQLRVKDRTIRPRRLDAGYYVRSVEITEI
jgi:DMSO/TMAO reductase YedYZ molybdopterin-dependent catalytic subunit